MLSDNKFPVSSFTAKRLTYLIMMDVVNCGNSIIGIHVMVLAKRLETLIRDPSNKGYNLPTLPYVEACTAQHDIKVHRGRGNARPSHCHHSGVTKAAAYVTSLANNYALSTKQSNPR